MANALRDANQVTVKMGSADGVPMPVAIDHVTGYLKVLMRRRDFSSPTIVPDQDRRDDNQVRTQLGTFSASVRNILIQNSTGSVRVITV